MVVKDEKSADRNSDRQSTVGDDGHDDAVQSVDADEAGAWADEVSGEPVGSSDEGGVDASGEEDQTGQKSPSSRRQAAFAVLRALVVLVVAAVAYQLVVPTTHVVRTRLARLVLAKPGIAAYEKTKPQAGEQNDTQTGIAALTTAAKRSPNQTGLYSIQWSPTASSGAGMIAFLLRMIPWPAPPSRKYGPSSWPPARTRPTH